MLTTNLDWNAFAHRTLVTMLLYGLGSRTGTPLVACFAPGELSSVRDAAIVVTVDGPELDAASFATARDAVGSEGTVAVVVASNAALGLLSTRPRSGETARADAYARARAWAALAADAPRAPAVLPSRLRELAAAASSAGLALVEPDVPFVRVQPKAAVDRAILATIALGATARPLLFVHEDRAPKGHLARVREERLLDGWIEGRRAAFDHFATSRLREQLGLRASATSLFGAALQALAEAAMPVRGKELLREARIRCTEAARAAGLRVTTGSGDAVLLAKELRSLWLDGAIEIYASDPATPLVRA